jgi:hypothetical protein
MAVAEAVPLLLMARDFDELEGSLLPTARQVGDEDGTTSTTGDGPNNAMAAVPTDVFRYDEATLAQERRQLEEEEEEQQQQYGKGQQPRVGHALTVATAVAPDDERTVRKAEHHGILRAEEEKEAIRNANRRVYSHNYHEQLAVHLANEIARRRDREGLQVRQAQQHQQHHPQDGPHNKDSGQHGNGNPKESNDKSKAEVRGRRAGGGYQFREYNMEDTYEPHEYQVKEYKSVYD